MDFQSTKDILQKFNEENEGALTAFKRELKKVKTGRASPGLLEGIVVDYYGAKTPLQHLGQIGAPEPKLITVQVYDASAAEAVEKAIRSAGLGLNPAREGNSIRINIPPLTEESRKEIVKRLHKMAEEIKVSVRNHRRDCNDRLKKLEKDGKCSEDDLKRQMDIVQKETDKVVADIDKLLQAKEAECMDAK